MILTNHKHGDFRDGSICSDFQHLSHVFDGFFDSKLGMAWEWDTRLATGVASGHLCNSELEKYSMMFDR